VRELLAAAGTLLIVLNEEGITDLRAIQRLPAISRTTVLLLLALSVHLVGYILGAVVGRWAEAVCHLCCKSCCPTPVNAHRNFP